MDISHNKNFALALWIGGLGGLSYIIFTKLRGSEPDNSPPRQPSGDIVGGKTRRKKNMSKRIQFRKMRYN